MSLNVVPIRERFDIVERMRRFVDELARGEYGEVDSIVCIIDEPDALHVPAFGAVSDDYRTIGLLEAAKKLILSDVVDDEC